MSFYGRRRFLLGAAALASSPIAVARPRTRAPVLGVLSPFLRPTPEQWSVFPTTVKLAQLGWIADETLLIEPAYAQGYEERLPELARGLVTKGVDVIWARGPEAAVAAARATKSIPIVFTSVAWPVEMGLASSLARPGGNVTGVAYIAGDIQQSVKPAQYLKQIAPEATRLVSLWSTHNLRTVSGEEYSDQYPAFEAVVRGLGFDYRFLDIKSAQDYDAAFAEIVASGSHAIIAFATPLNFRERRRIADFANRNRLLSTFDSRPFVEVGGLVSYGPDLAGLALQSVRYLDAILRGVKPSSLSIELPAKLELAVNLRTARALGVTIPQSIILGADRVID